MSHMVPSVLIVDDEKHTREGLQQYLDDKASSGLSHSVVAHLRWD